jgi:hypothetical protein
MTNASTNRDSDVVARLLRSASPATPSQDHVLAAIGDVMGDSQRDGVVPEPFLNV